MPIKAVIPNLVVSRNGQQKTNKAMDINYVSSVLPNNNLVDFNYGKTLVKPKEVSFKGNPDVAILDLSKKVSVVYKSLNQDDMILIGRDIKSAKEDLKESINSFKSLINRIFFIKDEKLATSAALYKNGKGFDEIINLGNRSLFVQAQGSSNIAFYKKGESFTLYDNDFISTKNPEYGFKMNYLEVDDLDKIPDESVQIFDFSKKKRTGIHDINLENFDRINVNNQNDPIKKIIMLKDVGGQDEAINEITNKILLPLNPKNRAFLEKNNIEINKGFLFLGPPGNGKSRTARALANQTNVKYFDVDGQLFKTKWHGESGQNIHSFYEELRANQPCLVFFDEVEAIFGTRGAQKLDDDELNIHLRELTKLAEDNSQVYLIGATNRPDLVDPAILRRLRTQIEFKNMDTVEKCAAVFDIHAESLAIDNFDKKLFMQKLKNANSSGDDIANIVQEAKLNAMIREGIFEKMQNGTFENIDNYKLTILGEDLEKAYNKMLFQRDKIKESSKEFKIEGFIKKEDK